MAITATQLSHYYATENGGFYNTITHDIIQTPTQAMVDTSFAGSGDYQLRMSYNQAWFAQKFPAGYWITAIGFTKGLSSITGLQVDFLQHRQGYGWYIVDSVSINESTDVPDNTYYADGYVLRCGDPGEGTGLVYVRAFSIDGTPGDGPTPPDGPDPFIADNATGLWQPQPLGLIGHPLSPIGV